MRPEMATSFMKRAVDVAVPAVKDGMKNGDGENVPDIPGWGVALFAVTIFVFSVFWLMLSYTLEEVIATLTMVETPMSSIRLAEGDNDPLNKTNDPIDAIAAESKPVPITSRIRGTVRHIVSQGGATARWRGFRMFIIYSFLSSIVNGFLAHVMPIPGISVLITSILLAPVHAGWTHAVIASPATQQKGWWSRILSRSSYKQLLAPSAAYGGAYLVLAYVGLGLRTLAVTQPGSHMATVVLKPMFSLCVYILVSLFLILPAAVSLARVEASLLPEDEDTIVPVDRTFNGKVVSKEYGGTGYIGFVDAWKSFDWEARRRLLKLYAKIFMIAIFFGIAATMTLIAEGTFVMGQTEFKSAANKGLETIRDLKM